MKSLHSTIFFPSDFNPFIEEFISEYKQLTNNSLEFNKKGITQLSAFIDLSSVAEMPDWYIFRIAAMYGKILVKNLELAQWKCETNQGNQYWIVNFRNQRTVDVFREVKEQFSKRSTFSIHKQYEIYETWHKKILENDLKQRGGNN